MFEPLQLADVCHECTDAVATDVEHAQTPALPDGWRDKWQVALGDEKDFESEKLAEGCGQPDKVVWVMAAQAVLTDIEVGQVDETTDVRRHDPDVVARKVDSSNVAPWWG